MIECKVLVFISGPGANGDISITNVSGSEKVTTPALGDTVAAGLELALEQGLKTQSIESIENGQVQYTFYCCTQCMPNCHGGYQSCHRRY